MAMVNVADGSYVLDFSWLSGLDAAWDGPTYEPDPESNAFVDRPGSGGSMPRTTLGLTPLSIISAAALAGGLLSAVADGQVTVMAAWRRENGKVALWSHCARDVADAWRWIGSLNPISVARGRDTSPTAHTMQRVA
jgi:hypothetical protein